MKRRVRIKNYNHNDNVTVSERLLGAENNTTVFASEETCDSKPNYEIIPASTGSQIKFLVTESEKHMFDNAIYSIRQATGNKNMKNMRYFMMQGAYAQVYDMYCCRSCNRVWAAFPGLAGEAPGSWDSCTCGSKNLEHLKIAE